MSQIYSQQRLLGIAVGAIVGIVVLATPSPAIEPAASPAIFTRKHCIQCHAISALDIKGGKSAPDLSNAVDVVKKRYGLSLDAFLEKPQGSMKNILGTMIKLTPDERRSIVKLLQASPKVKDNDPSQK